MKKWIVCFAVFVLAGAATASALPELSYAQDPPSQPFALGAWINGNAVEPVTHMELIRVNRDRFPDWLKAATFGADRGQINVVIGYDTEATSATGGFSGTIHWGAVFLGAGISGQLERMEWKTFFRRAAITAGVQF